MANEIITRSGITPNENGLPFTVTTADVENYLQGKIDVITNEIARATGENLPHVDIKVYTTEAGRNFLPFMIVLPLSVLEDNHKKKKNNDELPMFNPETECGAAKLQRPYFNMIKAYGYSDDDIKAFSSGDWKRARGVASSTIPILKSVSRPKINTINGNLQMVTVMLDPLRVFHDMLVMQGDNNRDFRIEISGWQKIRTGEFRFDIKRMTYRKKNNKKYQETFVDELNRKMRGR